MYAMMTEMGHVRVVENSLRVWNAVSVQMFRTFDIRELNWKGASMLFMIMLSRREGCDEICQN